MKEFLQKLINNKKEDLKKLQERSNSSEDLNEVRSIGVQIDCINSEIRDAEEALSDLTTQEETNARNAFDPTKALNVVATSRMNQSESRSEEDQLSSMEYRNAFMNYSRTGERSEQLNTILSSYRSERRAAGEIVSEDLGVLIPHTVMEELIKKMEKSYGALSSRVRMLNVPGGLEFALADFEAEFKWSGSDGQDKEHGVTETQKAGKADDKISFSYHIGEVRISQSLLQSVLTVEAFEKELVNALYVAWLKARDHALVSGTGNGQPTGITTDTPAGLQRVPASHIIEFTEEEMADWTAWQKKLFAEIPIAMEGENPEFAMAKQTYSGNLCTLKDKNNQPILKAGYDTTDGKHKFNDYYVNRTEKDLFKPFDECQDGEYFGMFWVPEKAYAFNTNMAFGYKKYYDDDNNKWVNKGLVIIDGKPLNTEYIFLLKKASSVARG